MGDPAERGGGADETGVLQSRDRRPRLPRLAQQEREQTAARRQREDERQACYILERYFQL